MGWDGTERRMRELAFQGSNRRRERSLPDNIARMKDEAMLARIRDQHGPQKEYPEATEFMD